MEANVTDLAKLDAFEAEVREEVRKKRREVMRSLGRSDAEIAVGEKISELDDRYESEIEAVEDAVADIIELYLHSPNSWTYDETGKHIPWPMSEASLFRPHLHFPYRVDVTGDIRQQTAEALRAMADDLNQAADRLEADEYAETVDDSE